jgi:hypothetical protein
VDAQKPYVRCTNFHAEWWYICSKKVGLLFIGDLDYPEIAVIQGAVPQKIRDKGGRAATPYRSRLERLPLHEAY